MKRSILLAFLALVPSFGALAQGYAVEVLPDKKVIHVKNLELPDNTPVLEVLRMIPELVVREGDDFLSGYDLSLDSKSIATNKDVVLATMKVYEIDKIEISTSATASQQVNGMAGSIKIVSKQMPEGFSGTVSTNVNTIFDVYPNFTLNYRTDKLEIRGNMGLSYYSASTDRYFERNIPPRAQQGNETIRERYFQETARIHLNYKPSSKDVIKVWLLESFDRDDRNVFSSSIDALRLTDIGKDIYNISEQADTSRYKDSGLTFSAYATYQHTFRKNMNLSLSADYNFGQSKSGTLRLSDVISNRPQTVRGEAKFTLPFLPDGANSLNMTIGGNVEYNTVESQKQQSNSLYLSPLLELKYSSKVWKVNTGVRYMHYDFNYDKNSMWLFRKGTDDIIFNVNTLWQMADHHALRLFAIKKVIRPSFEKMYPVFEWDRDLQSYKTGNENLKSSSMHSFELDYITDWNVGQHYFVTDLSFGYDRADGLVNMERVYDRTMGLAYVTYANSGASDIFNAKANFLYRYGIFSVSLAGNWYRNVVNNFNFSVSPVFNFRHDWTLSGTFRYNSALISADSRIGDCIYSYIRISKTVGKWVFSAMLSDIFGYVSENYEYKDGGFYYTMYDQYPRCFDIGVTYRIGR